MPPSNLRARTIRVAVPPYGQELVTKVRIHTRAVCSGYCAYHNPSNHHMKTWETNLRMDRSDMLVERICPDHGCAHPDPDSLEYIRIHGGDVETSSVHGCCINEQTGNGCCVAGDGA